MTDKPISPYLRDHPIRELCQCRRGPVNPEYETCEHCYLDAQADVRRCITCGIPMADPAGHPEHIGCQIERLMNEESDVIDLDEARKFKDLERLMAGDER